MPGTVECRLCGRAFDLRMSGMVRYCGLCRDRADKEAARVLRVRCGECGRAFSTGNRSVRYCSDPCRKNAISRGRAAQVRPHRAAALGDAATPAPRCRECGRGFVPEKGRAKIRAYCSAACRDERRRRQRREYVDRYLADPDKRAVWDARARAAYARRRAAEGSGSRRRNGAAEGGRGRA